MTNSEDSRRRGVLRGTGLTAPDQRRARSARSFNQAGFMVVAAGVVATVGAFMQWYAPARALVFPDLSGVGLSGGVVLVATIAMAMLGLAIAFSGSVAAAVLAAVAATALLAAAFLTMQNVAALNQEPSGVHYALEIGLWITATAGVLGLLGSAAAFIRWYRV